MSFKAKDGSPFSLAIAAKQHDARNEYNKSKAKPATPAQDPDEEQADESQDPAAVAAEHGPATQVLIKHEGEKHTVKSKHEDGHQHTSDHGSAVEAHQAASSLAGVGAEQPDGDEDDWGSSPQGGAAAMGAM
jgi:hypothetical protein